MDRKEIIERADDMGRRIYLAEIAGWKELVSMVGMPTTFASAIDILSILAGVALFMLTSGTISTLGAILALAGVIGMLRRLLA